MFHPSRECSTSPFQIFSFNCSRYHSATPCLTRRTSTVVALTPSMSAGSSVANSGIPCRDSSFSSFSALNMSRPERSMSSHTTAANRGAGAAASASRSAMPPSRGRSGPANCWWAWPWLRASRSRPPDSMSQYTAARNHPGGSQSRAERSWRRKEARGSCRARVEVRPMTRPGPARPSRPERRALVLGSPLRYLHDHPSALFLARFPVRNDLAPGFWPGPFPCIQLYLIMCG